MMPGRALRVSRYRPDAQAGGRIRPALAILAGPGVVLLALALAGLGVATLLGSTVLVMLKGAVWYWPSSSGSQPSRPGGMATPPGRAPTAVASATPLPSKWCASPCCC